jgi:hypothetical protein
VLSAPFYKKTETNLLKIHLRALRVLRGNTAVCFKKQTYHEEHEEHEEK